MARKVFQLQVKLDIEAVTCPGVWLCPNGKLSLQLYMLDSCIQTGPLPPVFPLLCHETFTFYKIFQAAQHFNDLHKLLRKECLYAELIQWKSADVGNVLATFQTSLIDFLFPSTYEGTIAGIDVDLLMEPCKNFPGIIAPKIEVNTKTTVQELLSSSVSGRHANCVVNPKVIVSNKRLSNQREQSRKQRKVCHSLGYHKLKKCTASIKRIDKPFTYRKPDEALISRKIQGLEIKPADTCQCRLKSKKIPTKKARSATNACSQDTYTQITNNFISRYPKLNENEFRTERRRDCMCGNDISGDDCSVCTKYSCYFDGFRPCGCCIGENKGKAFKNRAKNNVQYICCPEKSAYVIRKNDHFKEDVERPDLNTLAQKLHRKLQRTLNANGFIDGGNWDLQG